LGVMEILCCFSLSPLIDRRRACRKAMAVSLVLSSGCPRLLGRKGSLFVDVDLACARAVTVVLVTEAGLEAGSWRAQGDRYTRAIVSPVRQALGRGAVCSWQRMACAVGNDAPSSLSCVLQCRAV
jgi:hypothetical protein